MLRTEVAPFSARVKIHGFKWILLPSSAAVGVVCSEPRAPLAALLLWRRGPGCWLLPAVPPFTLPHLVPSELPAVLLAGRCEPCPDRPIQCLCFSSVLLCVLRRGWTSGLLAAPSRTCTPVRTHTPAHVRLLCCWLHGRPLWLELCCVCRGLLQDPESVLTGKAIIVTREGKLLSRKNY